MGAQSFDDEILRMNCRGHDVEATLNACALLRAASFKIVLHWMPNLLGATIASDREDFQKMWSGGFCPDEIKIYPTQLLREAPLYHIWEEGRYRPYNTEELVNLIADIKPSIPIYARVNRVIRDIPASYIQAGSRRSSLRLDVMQELERRGQRCRCIRCREIRGKAVDVNGWLWAIMSISLPTRRNISSTFPQPMINWPVTCACHCPRRSPLPRVHSSAPIFTKKCRNYRERH
jgi:elongator complex protein 3